MNSLWLLLLIAFCVVAAAGVYFLRRWQRKGPLIETGLKAIDLLVPIPVGGDVIISGDAQSGTRVLGMEMIYRLMNHPRQKFQVVLYLDQAMADVEAWVQDLQESLPAFSNRFILPVVSTATIQQQLSDMACGGGVAIFAASNSERFLYGFHEAVRVARETATEPISITTFAVTEQLVPRGYDVTMLCSRILAQEGIYPALHPETSVSAASSHVAIAANRRRVAESARSAITEVVQNLSAGSFQSPDWEFNRNVEKRMAVQAMAFMSQPYFVAEPFTGKAGANVPVHKTVAEFDSILKGKHQNTPPQQFMYVNELPGLPH